MSKRSPETPQAALSTLSREGLIILPKIESKSHDECGSSFIGLLRFKIAWILSSVSNQRSLGTSKARGVNEYRTAAPKRSDLLC